VYKGHYTLSSQLRKVGLPGDVMASEMSTTTPSDKKEDGDWVEGCAADFDFVRFTISDINGIPRSKLIPRRLVDENLKTGIGIFSGELIH